MYLFFRRPNGELLEDGYHNSIQQFEEGIASLNELYLSP
jgi:hypothetical protein